MALTINSAQELSSYVWTFNVESDVDNTKPLTISIYTEEGGTLIYEFLDVEQGVDHPYDFGSAQAAWIQYSVAISDVESDADTEDITVLEYLPTFTLPEITCYRKGITSLFYPTGMNMNENSLCPVSPLTRKLEYKRYEFDMDAGEYVLKNTETYEGGDFNETGAITTPTDYAYKPTNDSGWIPTVLTKVKIVVSMTNCSGTTTKEVEFSICGGWKIRRIKCGDYRIYNYKDSPISYSLYNSDDTLITSATIPSFSYLTLTLPTDGTYKIVADNITQWIFNYCAVEACVLSLQKQILLDDSCDKCKRDNILYQKALRLIPIYETWKKLLDKDGVYDIQYLTTDISGELARIYDATELYLELKKLCDACTTTKKCNC
jgi:hypothetical protein